MDEWTKMYGRKYKMDKTWYMNFTYIIIYIYIYIYNIKYEYTYI